MLHSLVLASCCHQSVPICRLFPCRSNVLLSNSIPYWSADVRTTDRAWLARVTVAYPDRWDLQCTRYGEEGERRIAFVSSLIQALVSSWNAAWLAARYDLLFTVSPLLNRLFTSVKRQGGAETRAGLRIEDWPFCVNMWSLQCFSLALLGILRSPIRARCCRWNINETGGALRPVNRPAEKFAVCQ